jgi:hypothetical protein
MAPCSLVGEQKRLKGTYGLHLQDRVQSKLAEAGTLLTFIRLEHRPY